VAPGDIWEWSVTIQPTLVDRGEVIRWGGNFVLALEDGCLKLRFRAAILSLPINVGAWTAVRCAYNGRDVQLETRPVGPDAWCWPERKAELQVASSEVSGNLVIGSGFSGKVEAPAFRRNGELAARWDFSEAMQQQVVPGQGPHATTLRLINAPRRGVTSSLWAGQSFDWRQRPDLYAAIHFHDDDLSDCGWPTSTELPLPRDAASGIYAVRIETDAGLHHVPVFARSHRNPTVLFLASTFTYLAYGNSLWAPPDEQEICASYPREAEAMRRAGLSTYCRHRDGSGVGMVSSKRPILNATPGLIGEAIGGQVAFNDDLRIIDWLDRTGEQWGLVSDHDLHLEGVAALAGARVLVTGSHPEYHSRETLDAIEEFTRQGGRLIYMGGNGFYWRVSTLPDAPHVMELRRAENGIRMWIEPEGQYHHQSDGEMGGLWRRLGRPPNRLVGVGYSAQADNERTSKPYVRTREAEDPRVSFLFEGVTAGRIGDATSLGAAGGYEMDRADCGLGTPAHALVVARTEEFGSEVLPVNEERLTHTRLDATDPLRADLTFFEGPCGGAVLATGSVLFAGALGEQDGAGRMMDNALKRFADPEPFELPLEAE
jgi:N,N-dimethylformamidase